MSAPPSYDEFLKWQAWTASWRWTLGWRAEVWDVHVSALEPDRFSLFLAWKDFLQGSGRLALGIGIGVISVAMGGALKR